MTPIGYTIMGEQDQLDNEARDRGIEGRSKMNKAELGRAVGR